jgi:hypothetical protein
MGQFRRDEMETDGLDGALNTRSRWQNKLKAHQEQHDPDDV